MESEISFIEPSQHLGHKIGGARRLVGITQRELADRLGVTKQAVSKLEQTEKVDDERLSKIAEALGVSLEGLKKFKNENALYTTNNFYENCDVHATNVGSTNVENMHNFSMEQAIKLFEELLRMEKRNYDQQTNNSKASKK